MNSADGSRSLFCVKLLCLTFVTVGLTVDYFEIGNNFVYAESMDEGCVMAGKMVMCDFEVFGRVQGVFFRKYTESKAKSLGINGWIMNTYDGTVKGQIQGTEEQIKEMKDWLEKTGSPSSKIEKATFSSAQSLTNPKFENFQIKR